MSVKGRTWTSQAHSRTSTSQVIDLVVVLLLFFPEGKVFLEELNDALGIAEVVLLELVNFVESLLESVISELASLGVILEHFVVEYGEVKGKAKLDGVAGCEINRVSLFISGLSVLLNLLKFGIFSILSDVAVIVTDHLDEEGLGLISAIRVQDTGVDHGDDLLAVLHELSLDLCFVGKECGVEF